MSPRLRLRLLLAQAAIEVVVIALVTTLALATRPPNVPLWVTMLVIGSCVVGAAIYTPTYWLQKLTDKFRGKKREQR